MDEYTTILIGIGIIILLMIANLLIIQGRREPPTATDIGQALKFPTTQDISTALSIPTTDEMKNALSASLEEKKISSQIGAFSTSAANMEEATRVQPDGCDKSKRAGWGRGT